MLYKKTAYLLMGLLLVLSLEVRPSSNNQNRSLESLSKEWNNLQYQQSYKGCAANAVRPLAKDCAPDCGLSVVACIVSPLPTGPAWAFILQKQVPCHVFACGLGLGFAVKTLKQECCDKPEQARNAQEQLKKTIVQFYTFNEIKTAFGNNYPLFLAMPKGSWKME